MQKKRSCRRTVDEDRIHEKAVKLRKMTDDQLIQYVEDRVEKARSEGFNKGKQHVQKDSGSVPAFLKKLQDGKIQGIGAATIDKLTKAAKEYGFNQ